VPLFVGACYITYGQAIDIGTISFTVLRILILAAIVRVFIRGEYLDLKFNALDGLMLAWGVIAVLTAFGHEDTNGALVFRLGVAYEGCGVYFLLRVLCRSIGDVVLFSKVLAILLVPVAIEMLLEKATGHNQFALFGGVPEICQVREGKIRAQGPFMHPILAGTVGAVCMPLMIGLWSFARRTAAIGLGATCIIVIASTSSGPMMSAIFAILGMGIWRLRQYMAIFRYCALFGYVVLDLFMQAPAYYLLSRFDLAGGSTGWHRAALIESALKHFDEWWLAGTDHTRHWMPTGVSWSPNHTDITNHYLWMGVTGGLPLMLSFIAVLVLAFSFLGRTLGAISRMEFKWQLLVWSIGVSLFANAATCISVAYFDQSILFLYVTLAAIATIWSWCSMVESDESQADR